MIPRLKQVCPWTRLLVVLRDPVDRAYSHYQMAVDTKCPPEQAALRGQSQYLGKAFEEVVEEEIKQLEVMKISHLKD